MRLTLAEPKYLKDSISIISELVNEARFKITPNALELVAMDPANVAMVIFKLLSSCFTEYNVKKETELAINLSNLKQIIKRAGANDMLTLEMGDGNKLEITIKGKSKRSFSLPILDMEEKEQKIPDLNFDVVATMSCGMFNEAIEDADIVAESATFIADDKKLIIRAEGDLSKAEIEMKENDGIKLEKEGSDKLKSKYSLEYLKKMTGGSKFTDKVTISFSKDYPLRVDYKVIDKLNLAFILAPRVEND